MRAKADRHKILIVDDDPDVLLALSLLLKDCGYAVVSEADPARIPLLVAPGAFDAVFLDMNFRKEAVDGAEGFSWMREILSRDPEARVIPVTAFGDIDLAVKAVKEGAADFILKPWKNEKLLATLSMALRLRESRREAAELKGQRAQLSSDLGHGFEQMIGKSRAMRDVFLLIRKVGPTDANVLILGENGTGKELVARALHGSSPRADRVFIAVDMGSITAELFESELFGHVKGAFTDARDSRAGRFQIASGGTLFLDEVGNLSPALQGKLLRVIERGEVTPVGADTPRKIDTRLICATNMPVYEMVARKEFRQDLLYRINTIEIPIPPLRDRREDIPLLLEHYCTLYCARYSTGKKESPPGVVERLSEYRWPGNVRELVHAVERAVIVSESSVMRMEDFFLTDRSRGAGEKAPESLDDVEREAIARCLQKNGGNVSRAAEELGLTRASLYRRMKKHEL